MAQDRHDAGQQRHSDSDTEKGRCGRWLWEGGGQNWKGKKKVNWRGCIELNLKGRMNGSRREKAHYGRVIKNRPGDRAQAGC